jgi:UDP-N-acetylglucosamine 2-epimerase
VVQDLELKNVEYNLLTLHRNYNVDNVAVLENILKQLGELGEKIIFPVHPRTRKMISASFCFPENIVAIEPQGYLDFITLENFAKRIITDSGGIQKEAYILGKPCITLRTETEWVETVEEKWNLLVNPSAIDIVSKILSFHIPLYRKEIFGKNVTAEMIKIINSIN